MRPLPSLTLLPSNQPTQNRKLQKRRKLPCPDELRYQDGEIVNHLKESCVSPRWAPRWAPRWSRRREPRWAPRWRLRHLATRFIKLSHLVQPGQKFKYIFCLLFLHTQCLCGNALSFCATGVFLVDELLFLSLFLSLFRVAVLLRVLFICGICGLLCGLGGLLGGLGGLGGLHLFIVA